ncbi:MAG: UvrB/UvrC motif-containing protein [Elusimicrobiota bacterium]|nr:UvrB/UvrC motif-containing protein [Elusimicrobiota bacterium]
MLCNICHRNEATVHFKGIFNDKLLKLSMCEDCAEKKGIKLKSDVTLTELISTLTEIDLPVGAREKKSIQCQKCGLTYSEFKETGKLGCGYCYSVFGHYLTPLITRIHGSSRYVGKKFVSEQTEQALGKQKVKELRSKLDKLLKSEQYEQAAEIRDEIRKLNET